MSKRARKLDAATSLARSAFDLTASGKALAGHKRQISLSMGREEHAWHITFDWVPPGAGADGCTRDLLEEPLRIIATVIVFDEGDECQVIDHLGGATSLLPGYS